MDSPAQEEPSTTPAGDVGVAPAHGVARTAHAAGIGTLIATYALADAYVIGLPLMLLAAWLNALDVFAVAAVVLIPVNIAACGWIDRQWDTWTTGEGGRRIEARLQKVRSGRILRHPAKWTTRASVGWFTLAAVLLNAVVAVALARVVGRKPVGPRKVRFAAVGDALFFAALFSATIAPTRRMVAPLQGWGIRLRRCVSSFGERCGVDSRRGSGRGQWCAPDGTQGCLPAYRLSVSARNTSAAFTRGLTLPASGACVMLSLRKIELMCFSTARLVRTKASAMAVLLLPSAIVASTSSSRGVSSVSGERSSRAFDALRTSTILGSM